MNLTVKDLPTPVWRSLKQQAAEQRRSLNRELVHLLTAAADEAERRRAMRDSRAALDRFRNRLRPMSSSVPLIRAGRREH
ncbi:MAG: FitA-like ribbon-helix-helix domain-containing protein [Terriglobales bacterium]